MIYTKVLEGAISVMEPDAGLLLINQETDLGFYVRYDVPQMF